MGYQPGYASPIDATSRATPPHADVEAAWHLLVDGGGKDGAADVAHWRTVLHRAEWRASAGAQDSGGAGVMLYMTPLGAGLRKGEMGGWCCPGCPLIDSNIESNAVPILSVSKGTAGRGGGTPGCGEMP
jgi:hypothetical protein